MKYSILFTYILQTVFGAPQLISFKDGKIGVNFFGYHAEAGLSGGQDNGGLLGGLHASAGTPWGQNAAAGIGGNVNGRAAGVLYAGAQATPDVGASAVLGGDTSKGGFSGTDAYANGKVASRTKVIMSENSYEQTKEAAPEAHQPKQTQSDTVSDNAIQKIKPPKKYYPAEVQRPARRQLIAQPPPPHPCDADKSDCQRRHREIRSDVVQNALQIPVGILQSLQQSLSNLLVVSPKAKN